jgi:hypothetical protein
MSFAGLPSRGREHCNVLSASTFSHAVWSIENLHLLPEPARCFVIFVDFVGGFLGSAYDSRRLTLNFVVLVSVVCAVSAAKILG